jgi:hypothetical protein
MLLSVCVTGRLAATGRWYRQLASGEYFTSMPDTDHRGMLSRWQWEGSCND